MNAFFSPQNVANPPSSPQRTANPPSILAEIMAEFADKGGIKDASEKGKEDTGSKDSKPP